MIWPSLADDKFERLMQVLTRIAEGIEHLIPPLPTEDLDPETSVVIDDELPPGAENEVL
jgi:hypothetical protein